MADARRSPWAALERTSLVFGEGAVALQARPYAAKFSLRGRADDADFRDAVATILGLDLPLQPNTASGDGRRALLWLAPNEWLATAPGDDDQRLAAALADARLHATALGDGRVVIGLCGARAADVLKKGTGLRLDAEALGPGRCAQTRLAQCAVLLHPLGGDGGYDVYCERSYAEYLWLWLADAALEFSQPSRR